MEYEAPDGHIMTSLPDRPVIYTCPCDIANGDYESFETTTAGTIIGIEQIKISRLVLDNNMTITLTESSDAELEAYKILCNPPVERPPIIPPNNP